MGRIYRIVPKNDIYKSVNVNLKNASSMDLLNYLSNNNGWYRIQAQRLLLERQDKSIIPAVKAMIINTQDSKARLRALYVLEGLDALDANVIKKGLEDSESGVRENAIILAEKFPKLLSSIVKMTNDPSLRVVLQATLSLGEFKGKSVVSTFAEVLNKHGQNEWIRNAVLSSIPGSSAEVLKSLIKKDNFYANEEAWKLSFIQDLSNIIAARHDKVQFPAYLKALSDSKLASTGTQTAALKGLKIGLNKNESTKELAEKINTANADEVKESFNILRKN